MSCIDTLVEIEFIIGVAQAESHVVQNDMHVEAQCVADKQQLG